MALTCLFLKSIFSTVKRKRRYITLIVNLKTPPFFQTEWLLFNFCKRKKEAKQNYKDFVEGADVEAIVFFFALDVLAAVAYLGISVTYLHSIRKTCADFASGLERLRL